MRNTGIISTLILTCCLLIWLDLTAGDLSMHEDVFFSFRLPRVFAAALAGIGLSASGLAMQTLFRNPLAGPFLTEQHPELPLLLLFS